MKTEKLGGAALIVGSVGFIATMALHPTAGGHENLVRGASLAIGVHALAIASVCVQSFGFLRFARSMRLGRPHVDIGLVAYLFAAVFVALAATVSGILGPALASRTVDAAPEELAVWDVVFSYNFLLNAALTQVFIALASTAMLIWSVTMLQISRTCTYLGIAGIVVGAMSLLALFSGHIHNNVHDVGLFVLGLSLWTIALGVLLCRSDGARTTE